MKKVFAVLFFLLIFTSNAFPQDQLLCDPGFEDSTPNGTFPDSGCWQPCTSGGQAGAVCTTTAACSGNNGLWEYTGEFITGWWIGPYQEIQANPGEVYYGYCSIRTPDGEGWVHGSKALVRVCFLSAQSPPGRCNDNIIACHESQALTTPNTPCDRYEVTTAPAPDGTNYVQLMLYLEKPQGTVGQSIVNFDDCYLEKIPQQIDLTIFPASGALVTTSAFDLTLILEASGLSVVGGNATFDGSDVTDALVSCIIPGTLISGGQTFRCPGLTGGFLGTGTHTFSVTLDLSDGSDVSDTVTWKVKENTEP